MIREHQSQALENIKKSLATKQKRLLIQMIQGSGIHNTVLYSLDTLKNFSKKKKINLILGRREFLELFKERSKELNIDSSIINLTYDKDFINISSKAKYLKEFDFIILQSVQNGDGLVEKYLDKYKGNILVFTSDVSEVTLERYKRLNFTLSFKYTTEDIFNKISNLIEDPDLKNIHSYVDRINKILLENNSKKITPHLLQRIAIESNKIPKELIKISNNYKKEVGIVADKLSEQIEYSELEKIIYRRSQIEIFGKLLKDENFFSNQAKEIGKDESVWQKFFEKNDWILGYGMTGVFYSALDQKKLEQVVSGFDFNSSGKRIDALMKSKGVIENLCFIELKTHKTDLLEGNKQYRGECWQPSKELSGAIVQIQKTVYKAGQHMKEKIEIMDTTTGSPTGEIIFNYNPKAYLIIGTLKEFETKNGVNMPKYSSFELFRKNIKSPEIITFDELYERVKFLAFK